MQIAFLGADIRTRYLLASVLGQHVHDSDSAIAVYTEPAQTKLSEIPKPQVSLPLITIAPDSLLHYPSPSSDLENELHRLSTFSLLFLLNPLRIFKSHSENYTSSEITKIISDPRFANTQIHDLGGIPLYKARKSVCDAYSKLILEG